jgi:hypothetical protein
MSIDKLFLEKLYKYNIFKFVRLLSRYMQTEFDIGSLITGDYDYGEGLGDDPF